MSEARGAVAGRIVAAAAGAIVWLPPVFECRVDDCESGRYGQPPGDHYEVQFEGQNAASGRLFSGLTLTEIGAAHGKSVAQVVPRWLTVDSDPDERSELKLGPGRQVVIKTARAASADSEVRPGPRPPTLRPHRGKTTEAGPSREHYPHPPCRLCVVSTSEALTAGGGAGLAIRCAARPADAKRGG